MSIQRLTIKQPNSESSLHQAIESGRSSDFKFLLAMISDDVRMHTPVIDEIQKHKTTDNMIKRKFGRAELQPLSADENSYKESLKRTQLLHDATLASVKLNHYLKPEALAYMPIHTQGLPEETFYNLSAYSRRILDGKNETVVSQDISSKLLTAHKQDRMLYVA